MTRSALKDLTHSLAFDGTVRSGLATSVAFANATQITVCGWVKIAASPTTEILLETGANGATLNGFLFLVNSAGNATTPTNLRLYVNDQTHTLTSACETANLPANTWLRFCFTIDQTISSNQSNIYLNGVTAVGARSFNANCTSGVATNNLNVAARSGGSLTFTGGLLLDRITIGKAYSAAEVLAEYQTARHPTGGTVLANYAWTPNSGLSTIVDSGSGASNIALTSPVWSLDTPSLARPVMGDRPFSVQGILNSDSVSFGNGASLQVSSGTIAAFVRLPTSKTLSARILNKLNAWCLGLDANGALAIYNYNAAAYVTGGYPSIQDGQWHHLALSFQSGVANGSNVFVDGRLVQSGLLTMVNQASAASLGNVGGTTSVPGAEYTDAAFWNVALTPAQIRAMYLTGQKPTSGLVSAWPLWEGNGTVINDTVGTNTGTIT